MFVVLLNLFQYRLSVGSEHTLNGRRYPMELHIVTYNEDYGSFEAASTMPKGLSVVTFFYDVSGLILFYSLAFY